MIPGATSRSAVARLRGLGRALAVLGLLAGLRLHAQPSFLTNCNYGATYQGAPLPGEAPLLPIDRIDPVLVEAYEYPAFPSICGNGAKERYSRPLLDGMLYRIRLVGRYCNRSNLDVAYRWKPVPPYGDPAETPLTQWDDVLGRRPSPDVPIPDAFYDYYVLGRGARLHFPALPVPNSSYPSPEGMKVEMTQLGWLAPTAVGVGRVVGGFVVGGFVVGGFVVGVDLPLPGLGYTNPPTVRFVGGGGSGARGVATLGPRGSVSGVVIQDPGSGYTQAPIAVFSEPPHGTRLPHPEVPHPMPVASRATRIRFGSIDAAFSHRLQFKDPSGEWADAGVLLPRGTTSYERFHDGDHPAGQVRLLSLPVTATAAATVVSGFVVIAAVTAGGSGYTTPPRVTILGGGGSGATAVAAIADGSVTSVTIVRPGAGYVTPPTVAIEPPTGVVAGPDVSSAVVKVVVSGLTPGFTYEWQRSADLRAWVTEADPRLSPSGGSPLTNYIEVPGAAMFWRVRNPSQ